MKNNKSLLDKYIRISVSHTLYVPSEDEFGIKNKLKEMEENKRLENIFEYPIKPESLSLLCRVMDDRDCDDMGYFEKSIINVGKDTFSCFQENGEYRSAKKGCMIIDITVLNDRGEEIVIMQFEIKKKKFNDFLDAFLSYINLYSFEHDNRFEIEHNLI